MWLLFVVVACPCTCFSHLLLFAPHADAHSLVEGMCRRLVAGMCTRHVYVCGCWKTWVCVGCKIQVQEVMICDIYAFLPAVCLYWMHVSVCVYVCLCFVKWKQEEVIKSYITGMLTNFKTLPLDRIHNMLKMFVTDPPYTKKITVCAYVCVRERDIERLCSKKLHGILDKRNIV